jgi:hypothetical protein
MIFHGVQQISLVQGHSSALAVDILQEMLEGTTFLGYKWIGYDWVDNFLKWAHLDVERPRPRHTSI